MKLPKSDRTRATERRYQKDKLSGDIKSLLDEPILMPLPSVWQLKANRYPYDAKWDTSHLLVYYRECIWTDIPESDLMELMSVIISLLQQYDAIRINGYNLQSVKNIPHVHLLKGIIS